MRTTKEDLQKQLAENNKQLTKVNQELTNWQSYDKEKRREFARAFGWSNNAHASFPDPIMPTWEQIYIHVGKLLADKTQLNILDYVQKIDQRLSYVENEQMNNQFNQKP